MDSNLNFSSHTKTFTKSASYHLENTSRVKGPMSQQDLEKLVHAFIFSRLDYCNSVFTGLSKKSIRQLQLIQNTAARVLTRTKKVDHITHVLRSLHWLPVCQRIYFKILLLVYKARNGFGPKYISDLLPRYESYLFFIIFLFSFSLHFLLWMFLFLFLFAPFLSFFPLYFKSLFLLVPFPDFSFCFLFVVFSFFLSFFPTKVDI